MRRAGLDLIYALALLGAGGLLLWETTDRRYADTMGLGVASDPAFYPQVLLGAWLGLSAILLLRSLFSPREAVLPALRLGRLAATVAVVSLYTAAISWIGFLIASTLLCLTLMPLLGLRRPLPVLIVGTLFPLAVWCTFVFVLQIPLPTSPWFRAL